MNANRTIHPYWHEGLWVFDEGQHSMISDQLSVETPRGTPSWKTAVRCVCPRSLLVSGMADR